MGRPRKPSPPPEAAEVAERVSAALIELVRVLARAVVREAAAAALEARPAIKPPPVVRENKYLPAEPSRDRILRIREMAELAGVHQHTIRRAGASGELKLLKLSARVVGARESEFWRWAGRKPTHAGDV